MTPVDDSPVEQFIRDVLPTMSGPHAVPPGTRHVPLIRGAAKDRGLSAQKVGDTIYFYDRRQAVGGVHKGRMTTLVAREAITICDSKELTKQMLQAAGLPTPRGITVASDQLDDAVAHVQAAGPSVLKPSRGMRGEGVTTGIVTEDDLATAWQYARAAVRPEHQRFVLEDQVEGIDVRAFVIGHRFVAAVTRLPPHVVGDGRLSVAALIEHKKKLRHENAYMDAIVADEDLLARAGRTTSDVPAAGEVIVLRSIANVSAGGESVDITDLVHSDLKRLAVQAAGALPGLCVGGVDLVTPDLRSIEGAAILEINAGANIVLHHHPGHGQSRDVAGAIVDEMMATAGVTTRGKPGLARRVARAARRRLR